MKYLTAISLFIIGCSSSPKIKADIQIKQYGITWTLEGNPTKGRYINGDWWVVGPVTVKNISPKSTKNNTQWINGSMLNPTPARVKLQGYDQRAYRNQTFDLSLNVANQLPLRISPGNTLVSTVSVDPEVTFKNGVAIRHRPIIKTCSLLTIVNNPPPDGSFRPAYTPGDKAAKFNIETIRANKDKLANLELADPLPNIELLKTNILKCWLDHVPNDSVRYIHPKNHMEDYGRDMASDLGEVALLINSNLPWEEKEPLIIGFVQYGIDTMGILDQPKGKIAFVANGGHSSGRKLPVIIAGVLLNDPHMMTVGFRDYAFQEDHQTFYVQMSDVLLTNRIKDARAQFRQYEVSDINTPEWGIRHKLEPRRDNAHKSATYRDCCTAICWSGTVLTLYIMDLKPLWNHQVFFDYQDRYMFELFPKPSGRRTDSPFTEAMWDKYRDQF